jgi:multidrug efflux pump subunit AcrA (membrane-fusion protein)
MSLGGFYVTPSKQLTPTIAKVTAADIIVTAAQGNDDQALQTSARIFNVASPGAFEEVFSIGHVNNTANPGSVLELSRAVPTADGKSTTIGGF